jgi:hypothetical protein
MEVRNVEEKIMLEEEWTTTMMILWKSRGTEKKKVGEDERGRR